MKLSDLTNMQFVDVVRVCIGLRPLYAAGGRVNNDKQSCGQYRSLEKLSRAADPTCARCGGSGYYDGENLEMRCPCTGLVPRQRAMRRHTGGARFVCIGRKRAAG
jgi:tRNA(Ile2) C34 agmatinyltransferase TiaS